MKKIILIFWGILSLTNAFPQNNMVKLSGLAQGTSYHISYFDHKKRNLQPEIETLLNSFNQSVSLYDSSSVICRVNKNQNVELDKYFTVCYIKAQDISKITGGDFDMTVGPLVNYWGFGLKNREKIDSTAIDSILKFTGYHLVELKNGNLIKKDPRVQLDFNALAQGYSVDLAGNFLESKGIRNYLVEIGGEVLAKGQKPGSKSWTVGIETPGNDPSAVNPLIAVVDLKNSALATSGNYRKFFMYQGKKYAHIINPHTGYPAMNNLLSVSVLAADCITADAYATAFMVMGLEKSKDFLSKHPELQAYMIYSGNDGSYQIFQTEGMKNIIQKIN